ncbi:mariner Mos1 transposase [Trichonephila clavipes]|nr:mariner Mos1 transposase [Trichonephila clavipes]
MASSLSNGLSSQRSPNTSYVHDIPIVPHQPATYKEYKEIVPDISVVSDIVDNESPAENFRSASQEVPKLSKYFLHGELTSETLPLNKSSLLRRNIYTEKHVQHTACEHNLGISSCSSQSKQTFDAANKIEDYPLLSKHPSCQCHAMNEIASERLNEQFSLPQRKSICLCSPRTSIEGKIERELNCSTQNGECLLNKKECKYSETFEKLNPCTDHNSPFKDNGHFSSEMIPNLPLTCTQKIQNCCCSKKQCLKSNRNSCEHEKHVSFDIELQKTDNPEKRQESKVSYSNSDATSRNCKKKNCQCQSKTKKLYLNSSKNAADSSTSDEHASENEKVSVSTNELLNIWEYIKQQDEKINFLQEQVKTLTENSSCGHKFSIEEIDSPNAMESDVPYILNILEVHGDKIQELQSQISSLSIIDTKSSDISNNENMFKEVPSQNCENKNTCPENAEQTEASTFATNTVCCEQVQVTKTSASTMTSLTFENNDKLVYHKQFTVVTDLKHTKEMPAGSELREGKASVRKNHLNKKGLVSNSRKKKDHNSEKRTPNLKSEATKQVTSSSSSDIPTSSDVQELRTPLHGKKDSSPHVLKKNEAMGKIIKVGRWVPHELTDRQQENQKFLCEMLLTCYKRKSYLHRIVTGDENRIYFENPKRNRSYVDPGQPSKSTARPNRFGRKRMLCIFWDQEGPIYYELLEPGETINTDRYKQQLLNLNNAMLEKCEQYKKQKHKVIFLDNAPSHRAKPTKNIVKALSWEPLAHAAYSPDLAPSNYYLFASLGHALADQRFTSYENVKS